MRVWITLSLIAVTVGCSGKGDGPPPASTPKANSGSHAEHAPSEVGHSSPSNHAGHEQMQMPAARKLLVRTEPSQPQAGEATKLLLQILDDNEQPITKFALLHEKLVHLIVVREGLDEFSHLHPLVDASGNITIEYKFPKAGHYRLFADHQPEGTSPGLAVGELEVGGAYAAAATLKPNLPGDVLVGDVKVKVSLKSESTQTTVQYEFKSASGEPLVDLEPYLGAMGHLVVIGADGRDYVHAHPLTEGRTAPDGNVAFAAHFPKPGLYKAWGQFQRGGQVFTVPGVLMHADVGHAHGNMPGMGPGMMGGRSGMGDMSGMRRDMQGLMTLLGSRDKIERQVKDLPNGVETITESDDEQIAKTIREHVAAMYKRLEKNEPMPMTAHDPLFKEVFKHAAKIKLNLEVTPRGLKVTETSDDPYVAKLIQAHARVVDAFMANGMEEVHREHPVPSKDVDPEARP